MKKAVVISVVLLAAALLSLRMTLGEKRTDQGSAPPIPGVIDAVNYDSGGQGRGYSVSDVQGTANRYRPDGVDIEACTDPGSGYSLGWAAAGNWFHYTVSVKESGRYTVGFRVSSGGGGGTLYLRDDAGNDLSGPVSVPATGGWQNWTTVYAIVTLRAGEQRLMLEEATAGFNIHYLSFQPGYRTPQAPTGLTARAGGGHVALMWAASDGAISYSIYRGSQTAGEEAAPIATGVQETRYTDTSVTDTTKRYYYRVAAVAFDRVSSKSEEAEAALDNATSQAPDFGPNTLIFDSSMPAATIQSQVDTIFARQQTNQFGPERYALLFKPGTYEATVKVGFYTQVLGLGQSPDDTSISGAVQVDAAWMGGNATVNFWRGAENLAITPGNRNHEALWAVSQACPIRRLHVRGNLSLYDSGWSSGGFMSDSLVDGRVISGSQQQWLTRNSTIGNWSGSVWNMVFVGVDNAPEASFPRPAYAVLSRAPVVREKPFLTVDDHGSYGVFVPALRKSSHGTTWLLGVAAGKTIPISRFYIAHPETDTAATINTALNQGKNLLLTPGIYRISEPIRVDHADTIVLGLGLATIQPQGGFDAMTVADIGGVDIAGLLFDAGAANSPVLLQLGTRGSSVSHSDDPTILHDVFFRIGGASAGRAAVSLQIDSNDVIADDLWLWRADHGNGVGWDVNTAANGLIVNGARVTIYGLAVEHYEGYQTLWNGNGGRVYFYQSEAPYDVPDQGSWMDGRIKGFASYKVADSVTSHEAWGLGIYSVFNNPNVTLGSAIEAPNVSGVQLRDMTTASLKGGTITHIANGAGETASRGSMISTLSEYP